MTAWTAQDIPDQSGRTVVVTGANSGIGLAAARELARTGAHVVLAVRDADKGRVAAAGMTCSTEVRALDLADLGSVRAFAAQLEGPIDVLINNAGVMALPERRTQDGFEMQFGTNHLGHFALEQQPGEREVAEVVGGQVQLDTVRRGVERQCQRAGVVDKDVDAAGWPLCLGKEPLNVIRLHNVALHGAAARCGRHLFQWEQRPSG